MCFCWFVLYVGICELALPSCNLTLQMYLCGNVEDDEEEDSAAVHTKRGHVMYEVIVP